MAFSNIISSLNQDSNCANHYTVKNTTSLLNEICQFNRVTFKYNLIDEFFVGQYKFFLVSLMLSNDEQYTGKGSSIRKAENEAALNALKYTKLKPKPKLSSCLPPTVELNALAMNLRQKVEYEVFEFNNIEHQSLIISDNLCTKSSDKKNSFSVPQYRACVKLDYIHYHGKGQTAQLAKQSAAEAAFKALKSESENKNTDSNSLVELNDKSPISILYELAAKMNFKVKFESISKSGLSHILTFVMKCTVNNNVTKGKGNSKKLAKQEASQKMLHLLKSDKDFNSFELVNSIQKLKKVKPQKPCMLMASDEDKTRDTQVNTIKPGTSSKEDINENTKLILRKVDMNPITRLIQLQAARKESVPEFKLISTESLNSNANQFVFECIIPYSKCFSNYNEGKELKTTGSGRSKKVAKANAADSMLKLLSDSLTIINQGLEEPANNNKTKSEHNISFVGDSLLNEEKPVKNTPATDTENSKKTSHSIDTGHSNHNTWVNQFRPNYKSTKEQNSTLHLKSEQEIRAFASRIATESLENGVSSTALKLLGYKMVDCSLQKNNIKASQQLNVLANALAPNVYVNYSDAPSSDNKYVSFVNVSFNICQSFAGVGNNIKDSRESAALMALKSLATPVAQ